MQLQILHVNIRNATKQNKNTQIVLILFVIILSSILPIMQKHLNFKT